MANTDPRYDDRQNPDQSAQPNPQGYESGYRHGQSVERQRYETVQQTRDENNTASGFLIGLLFTGLILGGGALAYFVTQRSQTPVRTIVVPSASPSPSPEVRERVIERDRIVPVPQPQQSAPAVVPAPTIRIESPKPEAAPSTQEPARSEQPSPEPTTAPSPEATASPSPSSSGQ
jgi:hypothetical protein